MSSSRPPAQPLGIGALITSTFHLYFSRFWTFFTLMLVPTVIFLSFSVLVGGLGLMTGATDPVAIENRNWIFIVVLNFFGFLLISGFATALMISAVYDAKLGWKPRWADYIRIGLSRAVPVALVTLAVSFLSALAAILLIIPGLYVYAVLSVAIVSAVVERKGFGAFGRSATLTQGYRWPILGANVLFYLIFAALSFIVSSLNTTLSTAFGDLSLLLIPFYIVNQAIMAGLFLIFPVIIYIRLRDIKEGIAVVSVADTD